MLHLVFIFLTFYLLRAQVHQTADLCKISDEKLVSNMAPLRSQDGVGFCYAFAAVGVLDQFYCKKKIGGCKYGLLSPPEQLLTPNTEFADLNSKEGFGMAMTPEMYEKFSNGLPDDRLSVLDAIASSKAGLLEEGGFPNVVLDRIEKQGAIALEKCSPYEKLLLSDTKFFQLGVSNTNWWLRLQTLYSNYQQSVSSLDNQVLTDTKKREELVCATANQIATSMREAANLATNIEQIIKALHAKEFEEFVKQAVIPESCEKTRVALPKFTVGKLKDYQSTATKPKIDELLKKDTPIAISMCTSEKEKRCDGHAVVISGARQKCCDGKCTVQYKIYDSSHLFWTKTMDPNSNIFDAWVSADEVLGKIEKGGKRFSKDGAALTWVE